MVGGLVSVHVHMYACTCVSLCGYIPMQLCSKHVLWSNGNLNCYSSGIFRFGSLVGLELQQTD